MALSLVTPPTVTPVSITLAKEQCGVTHHDLDALFDSYINAATQRCQDVTGRQLITATWDLSADAWAGDGWIEVPWPNLQSVTHVKYRNGAGVLTTLTANTDYVVEAFAGPHGRHGRISLAYGQSWPDLYGQAGDITIRFVAGYGADPSSVPAALVQGILLTIGSWYLHREDIVIGNIVGTLPTAAENLWRPYWRRATTLAA